MVTADVLSLETLEVGNGRHVHILDLIGALESEDEEDMLRMLLHGWTQAQVATEFGVVQSTISRRLKRLVGRAA